VISWSAWNIDVFTIGWIVWIVFFVVWEVAAIIAGATNTLTYHLRPLFVNAPITWFLTLGLYVWLGFHLLLEAGNPITGSQ
jgi:hypothetical protein